MANLTYHVNLTEKVQVRVQSLKDSMAKGNCDHDLYKHQCGLIAGLEEALGYSWRKSNAKHGEKLSDGAVAD